MAESQWKCPTCTKSITLGVYTSDPNGFIILGVQDQDHRVVNDGRHMRIVHKGEAQDGTN